ncbi:MAG: hypothetical protein Q7W02_11275 [Candidatus Rokubacteria bacterium]|nr:hypothetical protein [Candidatus Rokubacteria bacterium]
MTTRDVGRGSKQPGGYLPLLAGAKFLATLLFIILLATVAWVFAGEVLTNDSVVAMVRGGLPETVIVQKIQATETKFDLSTNALIALKRSGVSDKVLEAMMSAMGGTPPPVARSRDPRVTGELISHLRDGKGVALKLIYGKLSTQDYLFFAKQEVVFVNPRAEYRITERQPEFRTATPGEQWVLIRLKPGKADRNLALRTFHPFKFEDKSGVDEDYVVKISAQPELNGGGRVKPAGPLTPGEYAFVPTQFGSEMWTTGVFEFGVD